MPVNDPRLQRRSGPLNAWFTRLDSEPHGLLQGGRRRLLLLAGLLLALLLLNLAAAVFSENAMAQRLQAHAGWFYALEIGLLLLLVWQTWRELLHPLLQLCNWAELMRGVNLDSRVSFKRGSDFDELARDINELGTMLNNLSRDTEIQLQKHTDHITRESRALAILYDVASSINEMHDLNELFEHSLRSLCDNLNARAGIIRQFKGRKKKDIVASQGDINLTFLASADRFLPIHDPDGKEDLDRIYRVDHLQGETVFGADGDNARERLLVLTILLQYREDILGAIHLFFPDNGSFDLQNYNELLISIGQHLGNAVEKFRLLEEENEKLVMEERTRLSYELHDSLAQTLASLRIQVRVIDESFHGDDEKDIWRQMERIEYTIDQANSQLRELIEHFRVPINEQGLIPSIEDCIRQTQEEMGIPIYFQNEWPQQEFAEEVELNILRIVQECLANIRKHSHAEGVRVLLSYRDGDYILLIEDDGVGFDEASVISLRGQHLGLNILRDRAREINARLDIESEPDDGTRIHLQFSDTAPLALRESAG